MQANKETSSSSQQAGFHDAPSQVTEPQEPSYLLPAAGGQAQLGLWTLSEPAPSGSNMENVRICTNNCRGFTSKNESIEKYVIEQLKPDVINLEETMLRNKATINHKYYFLFCLNRPEGAGGGGIATLVANNIRKHATKVTESNKNDEHMV